MVFSRRHAVGLIAGLLPTGGASVGEDTIEQSVLRRRGDLPIVLTAPHGGREILPGVAPRNVEGKPRGGAGFEITSDLNTDALALAIADGVKSLTGRDVYLVQARFHRKFIDANRPAEIAYDSPAARPFYEAYHGAVRGFVDDIRRRHRFGLLLDIHGEAKNPKLIMRGTLNGLSIGGLLARAGEAAVTGRNGLFGQLESNGLQVFPANRDRIGGRGENAGFVGGFTVATYGSHTDNGVDAMQLEFGSDYRTRQAIPATARGVAEAIATFHAMHLRER